MFFGHQNFFLFKIKIDFDVVDKKKFIVYNIAF